MPEKTVKIILEFKQSTIVSRISINFNTPNDFNIVIHA